MEVWNANATPGRQTYSALNPEIGHPLPRTVVYVSVSPLRRRRFRQLVIPSSYNCASIAISLQISDFIDARSRTVSSLFGELITSTSW